MRTLMKIMRRATRRLLGLDEDRASIWSGIQSMQADVGVLRREVGSLRSDLDILRVLTGRVMADRVVDKERLSTLQAAEFKVFSQFGDDGIIQYLIRYLAVEPSVFVEFGVGDYRESNTRFLLVNNNWSGLIMDGNAASIACIQKDPICVFHDLKVECEFITRENINELLRRHGVTGPIGLLSVDIDGNDYWVWEAIDVVNPVIVVCEYNSVFGSTQALTTPYDPSFVRKKAHSSNLCYGASVKAFCLLAARKGYAFVGSNSNGNNLYFVRRDRMADLKELTPSEGYVESRFRESLDQNGNLQFLSGMARRELIKDCELIDVDTGARTTLGV
jgi:hypothetical protein